MTTIHCGDLFDVLPTFAEASLDACVTDPPYGIGFMGKEWDSFSPAQAAKKQGLRQLDKSPAWRDGDRRLINPNLKGRTVNGAISSSQIEYDRSVIGQRAFQDWCERWAREVIRVLKPGAHVVVCGAPRSFHRMTCGLEDAGFEIRDCLSWLYGQGFPKSLNLGDGRGTALKPGWEPIVLGRKPFKGSVTANVETHGTAALNIDACRIEGAQGDGHFSGDDGSDATSQPGYDGGFTTGGKAFRPLRVARRNVESDEKRVAYSKGLAGSMAAGRTDVGRWPANVCLDEIAATLLDKQSGELVSGANPESRGSDKFRSIYSDFKGQTDCDPARGVDIGGASRFYYVAKPSREERDYGTDGLIAQQRDESRKEGHPGGDNPRNRGLQPRGNYHPTVKPVALMRWLVRLVVPVNGNVLDPFMGSGTTGMACRYEDRAFIGIEREAEYVAIAEARIAAVAPLFAGQP